MRLSEVTTSKAAAKESVKEAYVGTIWGDTSGLVLQHNLLNLPWSDWKIEPSELSILARPDGSEWLLGSGASGRVSLASQGRSWCGMKRAVQTTN